MESGTGEWIHAEADAESGRGDDGGWPAAARGTSAGKRWGHGGIPGFSGWVAAVVAVAAAAAGFAAALFLIRGMSR